MNYTRFSWRLASILLIIALVVPWTILADNLVADGDGLTPVGANALQLGTVCAGATESGTVLLAISRNGNYSSTNVFVVDGDVEISVLSASAALSVQNLPQTLTIPDDWDDAANNTLTDSVEATVTLNTLSLGDFSGTVTFRASGESSRADTGSIDRDAALAVTATVVDCAPTDTTPPAILYTLDPAAPDGLNGWYVSDVTVSFTCSDPGGVRRGFLHAGRDAVERRCRPVRDGHRR